MKNLLAVKRAVERRKPLVELRLKLLLVAVVAIHRRSETRRAESGQLGSKVLRRLVEVDVAVVSQTEHAHVQTLQIIRLADGRKGGIEVLRIAGKLTLTSGRCEEQNRVHVLQVLHADIVHTLHFAIDSSSLQVFLQLLCQVLGVSGLRAIQKSDLVGARRPSVSPSLLPNYRENEERKKESMTLEAAAILFERTACDSVFTEASIDFIQFEKSLNEDVNKG